MELSEIKYDEITKVFNDGGKGSFTVCEIINGDTIRIKEGWLYREYKGTLVRILGYTTDTTFGIENGEVLSEQIAIERLKTLILDQKVDLINPHAITLQNNESEYMVYVSVLLNDINIKEYFPGFTKKKEKKPGLLKRISDFLVSFIIAVDGEDVK